MISDLDQRHYLAIARRAVAEAAELVRTHTPGKLAEKGDRDPVSEVDLAVERFVRDFLHNKTPDVEFSAKRKAANRTPVACCRCRSHSLPFIGTQYTALSGQAAFAADKRLHVGHTSTLADALISIDQYAFGEDAERKNHRRLRLTERLVHDAQRVRMLGSSAIDLAWTAEGRLDACIQLGNKPWHTSAGVLICYRDQAVTDAAHTRSPVEQCRCSGGASRSLRQGEQTRATA